MSDVKLSIIIPVYNCEEYLDECLNSVIKQDGLEYEIILVDDGSTDRSGAMCDDYMSRYDKIVVVHKPNGGLGSARNAGFKVARGEYFIYLDSDDYLTQNSLKKLVDIADKDRLDILLFGADPFREDGKEMKNVYARKKSRFDVVQTGTAAMREAFDNNEYYTSVCLRLYRKDFVSGLGIVFNESIIHEDIDYAFLTYIQAARTEIVRDMIYHRRYRAGSIMSTRSMLRSAEGHEYAISQIDGYAGGKNIPREQFELCKKYKARLLRNLFLQYAKLGKEQQAETERLLRAILEKNILDKRYYDPIVKSAYIALKPTLLTLGFIYGIRNQR